jgi:N-methylhydantoinase B
MAPDALSSKGAQVPGDAAVTAVRDQVWRDSDPMTFAVIQHALTNVVDEMGAKIMQSAYSPVVNEGRDFAASITTADGRLVAQGQQDLPAFIGIAPIWAKAQIGFIGIENFRRGDVVMANDPYMGGTHCMDVRFMMPVYWEGDLVAFVQDIAHWVDMGGPLPGGFNPRASHILQEAMRITPVHVMREGLLDENLVSFVLANVRLADWSYGDMMGQIQGLKVGEQRLHGLLGKYGRDTVLGAMEEVIRSSEELMRAEFARMPDGEYEAIDYIDRDPASDSDEPLKIHLKMQVEGDRVRCDLSGSSPQALGPVNGPKSVSVSALMVAIKSMFPEIPMNEGVYQAIDFHIPEGLVCSAIYPAPVSGMASACYARVLDCVYRCFIEISPSEAMACPYTILNIIVSGKDARPGRGDKPFVMYTWIEGGYGGRPGKKDNHTAMSLFASGTQSIPIESLEREHPVRFERFEYLADSEGAGMHRGGFGVEKSLTVQVAGAAITCQGDRGKFVPWGYDGGYDAAPNSLMDGELEIGVFAVDHPLEPGRLVRTRTNGGGGFGSPLDRPPEWVLEDVVDELITVEKARAVYGVEVRVGDPEVSEYELDLPATEATRAEARARETGSQ